jgi:ribosomal protein S19
MYFIPKELIKIYKNRNYDNIQMKSRASIITKELVGRTVLVHNGRY